MVNVPEGKIYHVPEDLEQAVEELELEMSPRFMGERIRKDDFYVEFGGPKWFGAIFTDVSVFENPEDVRDNVIEIIGGDIEDLEEGATYPIGIEYKFYGSELREDYDEFLGRQLVDHMEGIEGLMGVNNKKTYWMRISKKAYLENGLTLRKIGQAIIALSKSAWPIVERMEIRFFIGTPEVGGRQLIEDYLKEVIYPRWERVDARRLGIEDDDVDSFFGCTLCQGFAPNHVCILAPERMPFCGITSYRGAQISLELDPHGYIEDIPKGDPINKETGQYTELNRFIYSKSNRTIRRVNLYSTIRYPMTS